MARWTALPGLIGKLGATGGSKTRRKQSLITFVRNRSLVKVACHHRSSCRAAARRDPDRHLARLILQPRLEAVLVPDIRNLHHRPEPCPALCPKSSARRVNPGPCRKSHRRNTDRIPTRYRPGIFPDFNALTLIRPHRPAWLRADECPLTRSAAGPRGRGRGRCRARECRCRARVRTGSGGRPCACARPSAPSPARYAAPARSARVAERQ